MSVRNAKNLYAVVLVNNCAFSAFSAFCLKPVELKRLTLNQSVFRESNYYVFFGD